jgi:ABC-type Zn uptake system ZnuABC Zn-binding protein ZnuA
MQRAPTPRLIRFTALGAAVALLGLAPAAGEAKPRVVATLANLWSITRAITGDLVDLQLATRATQNPHDFEIRPSQMLMVKRADVLIRNGLEEDAWVDAIVEGSGNPRLLRGSPNVIEAVRGVQVLKVPTGPIDRSMGDIHPLGNPHYTLDPANLPFVTANIVAGLSRAMPDLAARFEANRTAFLEKVAEAERRWRQTLAPFRGFKIWSFHDTWPYFCRAHRLVEGGIIEDRPGIPPSPGHVAALIRQMREDPQKARVILIETWYPREVADFVARETNAKVLVVPLGPGTIKGTEDYIAHMDYLVDAIAKALA